MKKVLVVLTILVLVAGLAFADVALKGKFVGTYTFDFTKDKESQYYNPADKSTFKLTLAADSKELTGDSGVYAKAAVSIDVSYDSAGYASGKRAIKNYYWSNYSSDFDGALVLSLDTAEIVGEKWSLDLINTLNGVDYAKDGFDSEFFAGYATADKKYYFPTYGYSQKLAKKSWTVPGVTFNYDGFKVSVGYNNKYVKEQHTEGKDWYDAHFEKSLLVAAETKEFDFNGFKLQAFVGYSQGNSWEKFEWIPETHDEGGYFVPGHWSDLATPAYALGITTEKNLTGSVKAAYETEDVTASVAADVGRVSGDETVYFDVAANVSVKPVVFDFYFAKKATLGFTDKYAEYHVVDTVDNFMSMQAVVTLADVIENVPVTVTANAKNVLNAADLSVSVNTTAVENFDITVYFKDFLKKAAKQQRLGADVEFTGIEHVTLSASAYYSFGWKELYLGAGAEYAADMFTVGASVGFDKVVDEDAVYGFDVTASSDKLVQNATLAAEFAWDADCVVKDLWNYGRYLTLSCTIAW